MAMMTTSRSRPYHVIVFGASGFTGRRVAEEVARAVPEGPDGNLKWAIAGRSRQKLEIVLNQVAGALGKPELRLDVEIIVANVGEPLSLSAMCRQGVIILNCVGPYRMYGEHVVQACVENGAHCIDICGEPQFLEAVRLHYHSRAAKEGLYVIGSCGFNSLPADFGVLYTRDQFKGTLTSIESFLTISAGSEGYCINEGAWKSAIYSFSNNASLTSQRRKFGDGPLCVVEPRTGRRALFFSPEVEQYAVPFMGADMSVVTRTQRFLYETYQQTPVQYSAYIAVGGISNVVKMLFAAVFFWLMVKFSIGRTLLTMFPELFSFGLFSKSGPTRKQIEESSFCITFYGDGNTAGVHVAQSKPNAKICTQVKGPEPGYVATPIAMVQAAITLLNEHKSLPGTGGVYSPGAAFARTTLLHRLSKHGFKFSVVSSSVSSMHSLEQHDT